MTTLFAPPGIAKTSGLAHETNAFEGIDVSHWTLGPKVVKAGEMTAVRAVGQGYWSVLSSGSQVAVLTGEIWGRGHTRQLAALGSGIPYVPDSVPAPLRTIEEFTAERLAQLQSSPDATIRSTDLVRYLAGNEARDGSGYSLAVCRHSANSWPTFARELFASLFDAPQSLDTPAAGSEWIQTLLQKAADSASWEDLQRLAQGDPWASGVAAAEVVTALGSEIDQTLQQLPSEDPQQLQAEADQLAELAGEEHELTQQARVVAQQAQQAQQAVAEALSVAGTVDMASAVTQAVKTLEGLDGQLQGFGVGGASPLLASTPDEVRAALSKNPTLRKIADVAGRLRVAARAARRNKTSYVPEQIVDVSLGAELSRLLPSELMLLCEAEVEDSLLRRLAESQAQVYALEGSEPVKQGPIVLAIDSSSSMCGARYEWAMGVALALIERALADRRPFRLFTFADRPNEVHTIEKPRDFTIQALESMLTKFSGGGTAIGRAIGKARELIQDGKTWAKADLVLISDGEDGDFSSAITGLSELGVCTYGISIGSKFRPQVQAVMAGVAEVTDLQIREGSANVDVVFGLDGQPAPRRSWEELPEQEIPF